MRKLLTPPDGMPRITPVIFYSDVEKAIEWLIEAFGFEKRKVLNDDDGSVVHAELSFGEGVVQLAGTGDGRRHEPQGEGELRQSLYVFVDDVDEHYERAKAAGAVIRDKPDTRFYGDRNYTTEDLEGHHWVFARRVEEIPYEEIDTP
ncbi:VOC family protein [Streptosporangium sp. NPDC006930]|uniref:VOC family protein n=1 Tax=unclassified Streptosporangium TaxID=2632669 RepID=UPI00343898A3